MLTPQKGVRTDARPAQARVRGGIPEGMALGMAQAIYIHMECIDFGRDRPSQACFHSECTPCARMGFRVSRPNPNMSPAQTRLQMNLTIDARGRWGLGVRSGRCRPTARPPGMHGMHRHRAHVRACCVARTCSCACTYTFKSFRVWDARPTSPACCVWLPLWQPGSKTQARGKRCMCCF